MPDIPITAQLEELATARRLSLLLATHPQDEPEVHILAVLTFVAIDLLDRFSLIGGATNG